MSTGAHAALHRVVHWPRRSVVRFLVGVVAAAGIGVGIDRVFFSAEARYSWPPAPCVVQGIDARCGTFVVPENRAKPNLHTIGLSVVVLPARFEATRRSRSRISPAAPEMPPPRSGSRAYIGWPADYYRPT